jgi:hypothetical protein
MPSPVRGPASCALGRCVEQADQHARARSRNDVEFHARIVKRGHRARHQCQIRRAAAKYQCDCHVYIFIVWLRYKTFLSAT